MPSNKGKWRKTFDKRNLDPKETEEPWKQTQGGKEHQSPTQGACGASADEKQGRGKQGPSQKQKKTATGNQQGRRASKEAVEKHTEDDHPNKQINQGNRGRGRGRKPSDKTSQAQRPGRPGLVKNASFEPKALKSRDSTEVVHTLNAEMHRLKFLLRSQERQHNSDDFICDLTYTLARACKAPTGEDINKILAALKGSAFFNSKIPSLLDRLQESMALKDQVSQQKLIEDLTDIFMKYLTHLPSSYVDLPYVQLKAALDRSSIDNKEELQTKLDEFKHARSNIIRGERQKHGKRYANRAGEKPPNDFRNMPICPTSKEITSQERPFLRKNISKGRYENAEHYLDVQFRLLREDFLEPLREGIHEIVLNTPRHQRKHLMKNYRSVKVVGKEFTWSGIIHRVQIDVSGLDTSRWAHSKRLLFGSLLCLSKDNFKTMLFATISVRDPKKVRRGEIDIRFMEDQDVWGIESRNCVYQMVESPAYFEAYRHVLRGLKELDEAKLPFKKYLVECSAEVDPPEYLKRDDNEEPVCYNLSKALGVRDKANTTVAVPVLKPDSWPSVATLPLNKSQLEALKTAITTEFSVIQGPPGTGKTYVGTKIVRCLLENRSAWDPDHISPMLMVCYTNHALDQFLEKVLEFLPGRKIIRVGGRCKSEKLEGCNLKKFTYRYKLHDKRDEVDEKLKQNDREMRMSKQQLAKADIQLLEFEDVEELLSPTHLQQLCNAIFPSNVANESRTPGNTFKLWLCYNKQIGSCNRTEKESINEKGIPFEDNESFYDTTLFTAPQEANENTSLPRTVKNLLPADDASNDEAKPSIQQGMVISEENEFKRNSYERGLPSNLSDEQKSTFLEDQPALNALEDCRPLENSTLLEDPDNIRGTENPQTDNKPIEADEETIAVEREADLIQQQRWIQGDEDLLLPISKETGYLINDEQDRRGPEKDNDDDWTLVTHKKKGKSHFWMKKDEEAEDDEETGKIVSSKKKKKKKKKNKKTKVNITEDIYSIKDDLQKGEMMSSEEARSVQNIWNLSQPDRFRLYLFWIENYRERFRLEIHQGEREYVQLCEELKEVQFEEDEQVMRQATVVGMTTSGAARYHSVLQRIAPKIVVIEEAAEVMEAHIITSLSQNTKHTILIGDHKQLRPKATVYELAQKYNLEVSLFERMVLNSMECKRLSIQHRMRPEIANLTKRIYDHEIVDHDSVCHFPAISGVCHSFFFIDHCQPEKLMGGLQSYSNHHEADFLVALCEYLLLQGYSRNQITILTMYTGQLLHLQEKMPRRAFEGIKVCAVDNFQGEENDIILLSLVRSNSEGRIGFLGESNRICVALSRARQGFYCIGNFSLLKGQCKLWKEICDDLKTKDAIGGNLQLVCKRHGNKTNVRCARDLKLCALGGCTMPCADRLECGHACDKLCHASDKYHEEGRCSKMCFNSCPSDHKCPEKCHYPRQCSMCTVPVLKTPTCGHVQPVACGVDPDDVSFGFNCKRMLIKILPCGHDKLMECYKDPTFYNQCTSKCTKVLDCGHTCSKKCKQICQCDAKVEIQLPCNHRRRVLCRAKDQIIRCNEKCELILGCGHTCPGVCHEECTMQLCKIYVSKDLPCGHQQSARCFQEPQTVFCSSPCRRKLDCGHNCPSLCGRLCQEVHCKEWCQKKCQRGHPCQKQCHFGSSCDDCKVVVNATIRTCGHNVHVPCFINQASLTCKQPCERLRVCGHPCKEICGKDCETRQCNKPVARTLPCNHVVVLACHKNTETFTCSKKVEVLLPCGHKTWLECHVAKASLEDVLCMEKVEKELRCSHKFILPCHKNPEDCICTNEVDVKLSCGHMKSVVCSVVTAGLPNVYCGIKVTRKLLCGHEAILLCYINPAEYCCQENVEITLSCGHKKLTTCSRKKEEFQSGKCNVTVIRKLPCGHEKEMHCSDKADKAFCDAPCERLLPCNHPCGNKCGDDCASFRCAVGVKKALSCGHHNVRCLCSDDVSQSICSNPCTRKLSCGHQCPGKCFERCSQYKCQTLVVRNLHCAGNHSLKMFCKDDPKSVKCQERCDRKLNCGHPCPGLCSQPCETTKCRRGVVKKYACGHKEQLPCFEGKNAICKAPCKRREGCKHKCKGLCGVPCSKYPCDVVLGKTLPCGHKVKMPCSFSVDDIQCPSPCEAMLPCGHKCSGACGECKQRGSHEMCQNPCNRLLVCSHRCQAMCSEPCPPCIRKCSRRCPHGKCTQKCLQPCRPCIKPCTWICPHYQCNNPCGEECDRPRCNAPCPKKLPCHHPCIGLCGENCPTICAICHSKKLSSMIGHGNFKGTEATRCLQLFDCGHIVKVQEMDEWMLRDMGSNVHQIQCPRCSIPITFSYRYGNIVRRTLKNLENVKNQILDLGNKTARYTRDLLIKLRDPPKGILSAAGRLSKRHSSMALDYVQMHQVPFVFTLRNNLLIMHQIERAYETLRVVKKCQDGSNDQLQVMDHSRTISDALENMSDYLKTSQFDLETLSQLFEHVRTITLFASILEAQCRVITCRRSFSSTGVSRLKLAQEKFDLFMKGKSDVLHNDWLEKIAASLRNEANLSALPPEEPKNFKKFPGFDRGMWKLCIEHSQVYLTKSVLHNGEDVAEKSGCTQCDVSKDSAENTEQETDNWWFVC